MPHDFIGSGNGLVSSGNKSLFEPVLKKFHDVLNKLKLEVHEILLNTRQKHSKIFRPLKLY